MRGLVCQSLLSRHLVAFAHVLEVVDRLMYFNDCHARTQLLQVLAGSG